MRPSILLMHGPVAALLSSSTRKMNLWLGVLPTVEAEYVRQVPGWPRQNCYTSHPCAFSSKHACRPIGDSKSQAVGIKYRRRTQLVVGLRATSHARARNQRLPAVYHAPAARADVLNSEVYRQ